MITLLPCAPSAVVDDRFSLLDSDEEVVPLWRILETLLAKPVQEVRDLVELLDTLHCTIGHGYESDYGFLTNFIRENELGHNFFGEIWPIIVRLVLDTPKHFPEGHITVLNLETIPLVRLSRSQCACLVANQFLCSIPRPQWYPDDRSHDFHIWYKEEQPHPKIVGAYLTSVFTYFLQRPFGHYLNTSVCFALTSTEQNVALEGYKSNAPLIKPQYTETVEAYFPTAKQISAVGEYNIAEVVSANKDIGFGRSGSQEEILVGTSPEACPAVLFTTTLRPEEVFVVEGALSMTSVIGYNRTSRLHSIETFPGQSEETCSRRALLFMDALELDGYDGKTVVPDLLPGNVSREYRKAIAAFTSHRILTRAQPYKDIVTPVWGCGAFCGDPGIKTLIMLCAASVSQVTGFYMFNIKDRKSLQNELHNFVDVMEHHSVTVGLILGVLESISPADVTSGRNVFEQVKSRLLG